MKIEDKKGIVKIVVDASIRPGHGKSVNVFVKSEIKTYQLSYSFYTDHNVCLYLNEGVGYGSNFVTSQDFETKEEAIECMDKIEAVMDKILSKNTKKKKNKQVEYKPFSFSQISPKGRNEALKIEPLKKK